MGAAASPNGTQKSKTAKGGQPTFETCGATTRNGGRCRRRAGFGTDHVGAGNCKLHGGATPNGIIHAARVTAQLLGAELEMDPHDALLLTVRRAAAWERYCAARVAEVKDEELVVANETHVEWDSSGDRGHGSEDRRDTTVELNVWLREHHRALDQLARLSKTAIDAGVAERQVRLAEQLATDIARVIDVVLAGHGITGTKRKPAVVREALQLIQGGRAA